MLAASKVKERGSEKRVNRNTHADIFCIKRVIRKFLEVSNYSSAK